MAFCSGCGKELSGEFPFCPFCGAAFAPTPRSTAPLGSSMPQQSSRWPDATARRLRSPERHSRSTNARATSSWPDGFGSG